MASCDDDFSLLNDNQTNHNHNHHHHNIYATPHHHGFTSKAAPIHQRIPDAVRVNPGGDDDDDDNGDTEDDVSDSAFNAVNPFDESSSHGAYMDKFTQLNRGNLRGRDWEEVAVVVSERCEKNSKSVEQCKNKVDNLKKRYKLERNRMINGSASTSHWPWFKKMEDIVGNSLSSVKAGMDEDKGLSTASVASVAPLHSIRQAKRFSTSASSPARQITLAKPRAVTNPKWRRVVFKISGVALTGTGPNNIDSKVAMQIAKEVAFVSRLGVQVAVIVGSRNFFCGDTWVSSTGSDRCTANQVGMMASMMNAILIQSALEKMEIQTRLQTSYTMPEVAEPYSRQRAIRHLEKGRVVIFGGIGACTGNPVYSTDAVAALRALEIHAEAVLKGTNVDGVYDCHSRDNNITFEHITFRELSQRGATSMDLMALNFCEESGIPVVVFNLLQQGNITKALCGEQEGSADLQRILIYCIARAKEGCIYGL
ncbi:hypothetical protein ACFE04_002038 [Oxalis oulophora]